MTDLVPCPLCGANEGFRSTHSGFERFWNLRCIKCNSMIASVDAAVHACGAFDAATAIAWNDAGKHAQGLRDEIERLRDQLASAHGMLELAIQANERSTAMNRIRERYMPAPTICAALSKEPKMIYPLCLICGRPRVCASSPVSAIRAICGCPGYIPAEDRGYPDAEDEVRRLFDLVASQQAEIARLQTGHDLYEVVRRMSVSQFYGACTRHYIEGIPLDDILEGRAHEFGLTVRRAP